jgi:hypothetical protein
LTFGLGQGKVVLNSMEVTMVKTNNRLQELLAPKSTINLDGINKQRMSCEFLQVIFCKLWDIYLM